MGSMQQAVLEFDQEVRAPWRPRLVPVPAPAPVSVPVPDAVEPPRGALVAPRSSEPPTRPAAVAGAGSPRPHPARRAASRIGGRGPRPTVGAVPGAPSCAAAAVAVRPVRSIRRAAPARPGPDARRGPRVRLTRRARILAVVLALGVAMALGSWLGWLLDGGGDLRLAGDRSVVVQSGDTLWSIATSLGGDGDVRAVIDEIERLNGLEGGPLQPGQELRLP